LFEMIAKRFSTGIFYGAFSGTMRELTDHIKMINRNYSGAAA